VSDLNVSLRVGRDIDLPQIAVLGSQSAGKSSLIEAISGITLPRAAGTCTRYEASFKFCLSLSRVFLDILRCPTECHLSFSNEPWRCEVALQYVVDKDGQSLGQPRTENFGDVIVDQSHVEERIRRAQRAILNPSSTAKRYLDGEEDDGKMNELTFSHNRVLLRINGPDVVDLSFCDLPGAFLP
jgi:GTPase SAR1 family protein